MRHTTSINVGLPLPTPTTHRKRRAGINKTPPIRADLNPTRSDPTLLCDHSRHAWQQLAH